MAIICLFCCTKPTDCAILEICFVILSAVSKTRMLDGSVDGLEGAGAAPANFKPLSDPRSILVFGIAPINWFQTACVC